MWQIGHYHLKTLLYVHSFLSSSFFSFNAMGYVVFDVYFRDLMKSVLLSADNCSFACLCRSSKRLFLSTPYLIIILLRDSRLDSTVSSFILEESLMFSPLR